MGLKRFQQIHRFFSLNSDLVTPTNTPWFYHLQPIANLIHTACQNAYKPSFYIAINEAIIAFKGWLKHIIKIKGKPINTGYKI
jgi:hypothetical protein